MPLYEYLCGACSHRFERIQKFSDPPVDACPSCGGAVRKLLSSPAIQFKGTGWYITDYAKKGSGDGKGAGADKGDMAEKGEKGEKKDSAASSDSASASGSGSAAGTGGTSSTPKSGS